MCKTNKRYYQVVCDNYDEPWDSPLFQSFATSEVESKEMAAKCNELWPANNDHGPYYVIEGTEYIKHKCRECQDPETDERYDFYGLSTGHWCNDCYENNYPYRKDAYFDPDCAGESLYGDDDY